MSKPFEYSGYSSAAYDDFDKSSTYIEMADGTRLAADVFVPASGPEANGFPVVLQYTPYGRAMVIPDQADLTGNEVAEITGGGEGRVVDRSNSEHLLYGSTGDTVTNFLAHGYAYVAVDMRGTGASYGSKFDFSPQFADDGREVVDWIAAQPWSDGNVGMFGGSYLGFSQLATASRQPEALKAIFPEVVPLDGYTGEIRPGGVFLWTYSQQDVQQYIEQNYYRPDGALPFLPAAPVIDEDGDGSVTDEVPLGLDGDGSFLDDYRFPDDPTDPPRYADGEAREHRYYLATRDHLDNPSYGDIGPELAFIDIAYPFSPGVFLDAIAERGIAVYNHGSWKVQSHHDSSWEGGVEDASGTALVIALAHHYGSEPAASRERTLLFSTFSSHWTGYQSHEDFVERYVESDDSPYDLVANVTLEHVGRFGYVDPDTRELVMTDDAEPRAIINNVGPELQETMIDALREHDLRRTLLMGTDLIGMPTDAAWVHHVGVPTISLISGPIYLYDEVDTVDKVHVEDLLPFTEAFAEIIEAMDPMPRDTIVGDGREGLTPEDFERLGSDKQDALAKVEAAPADG